MSGPPPARLPDASPASARAPGPPPGGMGKKGGAAGSGGKKAQEEVEGDTALDRAARTGARRSVSSYRLADLRATPRDVAARCRKNERSRRTDVKPTRESTSKIQTWTTPVATKTN